MSSQDNQSIYSLGVAFARDVWASFGWRVALLVGLTLASATLEGLTLAALVPVLQFGGTGGETQLPRLVSVMMNIFGGDNILHAAAKAMAILLPLSILVFLAQAYLSTKLQSGFVALWQKRLFNSAIAAEWSFWRRRRSGEFVNALTTEAPRLGTAFYLGNLIVSAVIFLGVQLIIASLLSPLLTWIMIGSAAVLFRASRTLMRRAVKIGGEQTEANASLFTVLGEITGSVKSIKATGFEDQVKGFLGTRIDTIQHLLFQNLFDVQLVRAIFEYASAIMIIALLLLGPTYLNIGPAAALAVLAIFVRLFPKVSGLRQWLHSIALLLPGHQVLRELLHEAEAAREHVHPGASPRQDKPARIKLDRVSVIGDKGEQILRDITVDIAPGEHVAFVGPSGAGKTTLLDCILGLARPSGGDVIIDGQPMQAVSLAEWRRAIGYVGQDPVVLAGTVRENVTWNRTDVPDEQIVAALKAADAEFILMRPGGIDAPVAERGGTLSGGERQRIALARAFLGSPSLLVLDEATSAVDPETERRISEALSRRRGKLTIVTVTHRLASVRDADRIVLLEHGAIVEKGEFSQLLAGQGRFAAMWHAQGAPRAKAVGE